MDDYEEDEDDEDFEVRSTLRYMHCAISHLEYPVLTICFLSLPLYLLASLSLCLLPPPDIHDIHTRAFLQQAGGEGLDAGDVEDDEDDEEDDDVAGVGLDDEDDDVYDLEDDEDEGDPEDDEDEEEGNQVKAHRELLRDFYKVSPLW